MSSKKYLITGFSGFVSKYFISHLNSLKTQVFVMGLDVNEPDYRTEDFPYVRCEHRVIDLLDSDKLNKVLYDFQPDYILHLASYSSVAFSWKNPLTSFSNNTNIFLNLLEQVRSLNLTCRILSIGSSEEYGKVTANDLPLNEESLLKPLSPYAVARVSQEMMSKVYVDGFKQDVVITRSFNHIGPGQKDIFVISSFAKQLADIKKNNLKPEITTGNLTIVRDFLDVRDVVRAYHSLFEKGKAGEVYNICSGTGTSLHVIVTTMMQILDLEVEIKVDPNLIRPDDNPVIVGSNKKIQAETGWKMHYSLEKSLADIMVYWSERV